MSIETSGPESCPAERAEQFGSGGEATFAHRDPSNSVGRYAEIASNVRERFAVSVRGTPPRRLHGLDLGFRHPATTSSRPPPGT